MARFVLRLWGRRRVACLALAAAVAASEVWFASQPAAQVPSPPPPSIRTEFHRHKKFEIPFAIPPGQQNDAGKEVRLYASLDRGRTWQRAGTASLTASAFSVGISENHPDGECLFALMLAPTTQRDTPNAQYRPSYRAIIDTQPPKVELYARTTPSGAVTANWRIADLHLDRDTFALSAGPAEDMQPVALEPPRGNADPTTLVGSTSWWPARGAKTILVRARVVDRAGNPAVTTVQVDLPAEDVVRSPPAADTADPGDETAASRRYAPPAADAPPTITSDAPRSYTREASLPREGDAPPGEEGFAPTDKFTPPPTLDPRRRAAGGERQEWDDAESTAQTLPRRGEPGPTLREDRPPPDYPPLNQPSNAPAEELPAPSAVRPPVTRRIGPADDDTPPGERPRVLGSRRISLAYDVASVGPSGVGEVELWATNDGGRTWQSLGIDPDNRSPFTATLAGEGLYGFRIVVRNGNRTGGPPPAPGDLPEMWVVVDETKPTAAITAADVRATDAGRELVIRYEATDARLAARPIALYYADKPVGPWRTIGAGLANTGSHVWPLDRSLGGRGIEGRGVGDRVYLRLEVRDEAGNVGAFETAGAITLDEREPVGRIRSVDSPSGASVLEAWPRYR